MELLFTVAKTSFKIILIKHNITLHMLKPVCYMWQKNIMV